MRFALAAVLLIQVHAGLTPVHALQLTRIDSVTVDSVWNSDTTMWGYPTERRDVQLSFIPVAEESVTCVVDMSLDGGSTWTSHRDLYEGVGSFASFRAAPNTKNTIVLRVAWRDTTNVKFRVIARNDNVTLGQFRRPEPVTNWIEEEGAYEYFRTGYDLRRLINGHYILYFQNGVVEGFMVSLTNDSLRADEIVMECGTNQRAANTYDSAKTRYHQDRLLPIPGYSDSVAIAYRPLSGFVVHAHFRHFYFELTISGPLAADSTQSFDIAESFLSFYQQKADMMADE